MAPLLVGLAVNSAVVTSASAAIGGPGQSCLEAAADAQDAWQLPGDVLVAIGRVESGRYDPVLGGVAPWPWTINALGRGQFFATKAEAMEAAESLAERGVDSVDVGCFQVNLHYHPGAFETLEQAFDPAANANYAARFLTELRARSGGWQTAVALYHSGLPGEGEAYRQRVMVSLGNGGALLGDGLEPTGRVGMRATWPAPDPYVMLISAAARSVHIVAPERPIAHGGLAAATLPVQFQPSRPIGRLRPFRLPTRGPGGLPRIITPGSPL